MKTKLLLALIVKLSSDTPPFLCEIAAEGGVRTGPLFPIVKRRGRNGRRHTAGGKRAVRAHISTVQMVGREISLLHRKPFPELFLPV